MDIGGKYASDASSTSHGIFKTKYRSAVYHLKQTGSQVIVVDSSNVVRVDGTRNGNIVTFTTDRSGQSCECRFFKGHWIISDDGSKLEGSWKRQGGASGKWSLTKIE